MVRCLWRILHRRYIGVPTGVMDRGSKKGEKIVHVHQVGTEGGDFTRQPCPGAGRTGRLLGGLNLFPYAFDRIVGDRPQAHLMSAIHEKRPFIGDHNVLAAGLLIEIMGNEDAHVFIRAHVFQH